MESHASQKCSQMASIQYVEAQIIEAICHILLILWMAFSSVKPVSPSIHNVSVFSDLQQQQLNCLYTCMSHFVGSNTRLGRTSKSCSYCTNHTNIHYVRVDPTCTCTNASINNNAHTSRIMLNTPVCVHVSMSFSRNA